MVSTRGLAAIFDIAAFRQAMIAPVKKSVNHSKTVTSMREMRMTRATIRAILGTLSIDDENVNENVRKQ